MTIQEAITRAKALTGDNKPDALLVRWLSEYDGKLALTLYHNDSPEPYDPISDLNHDLLVPFPHDQVYVHYLEAMIYFANGEYDRVENARAMQNKALADYKAYVRRTGQELRSC